MARARKKSTESVAKRIVSGVAEGRLSQETVQHMIDSVVRSRDKQIEKLQKDMRPRKLELTDANIVGALKSTIHAHGPITSLYITSAAKRIRISCMKVIQETKGSS